MFECLNKGYCGGRDIREEAILALQHYGIDAALPDKEVDSAVKEAMKCIKDDDIDFYTINTALRTLGYRPIEDIGCIEWSTQRPKLDGEFLVFYKETGIVKDYFINGLFSRERNFGETPLKWVAL